MIDRSKSNLKIKQKTKKKAEANKIKSSRRQIEKELLENVNIIFGIDNGVTRYSIMYITRTFRLY